MGRDFYLHEDEWGMVSLDPSEVAADRTRVVDEARAHGEAARAPGGIGYTSIYVAPPAPVELSVRGITRLALDEVLRPAFVPFDRVISGYSDRETVATAFALHRRDAADGDPSDLPEDVFYGTVRDGVVCSLCVTRATPALADALHRLGTRFRLVLTDLWSDTVVDLADREAVERWCTLVE